MTGKQLRAFALGLPEAVEKPHLQRTSLQPTLRSAQGPSRVRDKIFVTMSADEKHAALKIAAREERYRLIAEQPDAFEDLGGSTARRWKRSCSKPGAASPPSARSPPMANDSILDG